MLRNLKNALEQRNITYKDVGELIGKSEKSVYSKINEETEFTLREILKIQKFLFPEYDLYYLFATDKNSGKSA